MVLLQAHEVDAMAVVVGADVVELVTPAYTGSGAADVTAAEDTCPIAAESLPPPLKNKTTQLIDWSAYATCNHMAGT